MAETVLTVKKIMMMTNTMVTFAVTTITGIVTYIVGFQRSKKEVEGAALKNIQTSLDIYKVIIDNLKDEITELLIKVNALEDKVDFLTEENHSLRVMLKKQKKEK